MFAFPDDGSGIHLSGKIRTVLFAREELIHHRDPVLTVLGVAYRFYALAVLRRDEGIRPLPVDVLLGVVSE